MTAEPETITLLEQEDPISLLPTARDASGVGPLDFAQRSHQTCWTQRARSSVGVVASLHVPGTESRALARAPGPRDRGAGPRVRGPGCARPSAR